MSLTARFPSARSLRVSCLHLQRNKLLLDKVDNMQDVYQYANADFHVFSPKSRTQMNAKSST